MELQEWKTISIYSLWLGNLTGYVQHNAWSPWPVKSPMEIQDHPLKIAQHYCLKQEAGT